MPGFVRTEEDEKKWQKAKKIVQEQHGDISWPLVTHVFQQMKKGEVIKDPTLDPEYRKKLDNIDKQIKIQKLKQQGVPTLPTKEEKEVNKNDDYDDYDSDFSRIRPYTKEDFRHDITSNDTLTRIKAIRSEHMTPDFVVHTLRNDPSSMVRHAAWESPAFNHEKHWQHVKDEDKPFVKPVQLKTVASNTQAAPVTTKPRGRLSVVKSKKELNDLSKALSILKASLEILHKAEKDTPQVSPEEAERMRPWVEKGFNHQEAAHLSGVKTVPYSLKSTRRSEEMSETMLGHAKKYAQQHVKKLRQIRGESAEAHHNPVIYENNQREKIHNNIGAGLKEHLMAFKSSGALDSMSPGEKMKAIKNEQARWYAMNKETEHQKHQDAHKQLQDVHDQATNARRLELLQQRMHMLSGGSSFEPSEYEDIPEDVDYSEEDAKTI